MARRCHGWIPSGSPFKNISHGYLPKCVLLGLRIYCKVSSVPSVLYKAEFEAELQQASTFENTPWIRGCVVSLAEDGLKSPYCS
ncbi:hypothetical protein I7I48_10787 [Histoplasma ohiense]|nr:hypothetical protein I7I48_10787 [Histoplasma ohiense (nom. inval.)]